MSWTDRMLLGFDLETTSAIPREAIPVSFALAKFDNGVQMGGRTALVNPGVPIPPETTAIHGITDEMVQERGGDLLRSIEGIVNELVLASHGSIPVVGCNLRYDLTVIDTLHRKLVPSGGLRQMAWHGPAIDILVIDRGVDKYRKGKRTLVALCQHYGVELSEAHDARADATASCLVALAIAKQYPEVGESGLGDLHLMQKKWHREWAEGYSQYRVERGDEPLHPSETEWPLSA